MRVRTRQEGFQDIGAESRRRAVNLETKTKGNKPKKKETRQKKGYQEKSIAQAEGGTCEKRKGGSLRVRPTPWQPRGRSKGSKEERTQNVAKEKNKRKKKKKEKRVKKVQRASGAARAENHD